MTNSNSFVPERFRRVVGLHIVKNLLPYHLNAPLILGIHGPSGFGKTFQCNAVLNEMNVKPFLISGGQMESHQAGEPAKLIRTTYIQASHALNKGICQAAALVINDIDTGLGHWGDMVQYTVNRQTVFGELMHLVDFPNSVENLETKRIPIILTGNDFTKLYAPLVRAGRMTAFEWIPSFDEMTKIIHYIFPELEMKECVNLLQMLNKILQDRSSNVDLSIAFFSHLRANLIDDQLWSQVNQVGLRRSVEVLYEGAAPKLDFQIEYETVLHKAQELLSAGQLINHL